MKADKTARPITTEEKFKIVVDAIVLAHFVVANLCLVLGYFTKLFDSFKSASQANGGVDFVYQVLDYPVGIFMGFLLSCVQTFFALLALLLPKYVGTIVGYLNAGASGLATVKVGSGYYYILAECTILLGSVLYGALAYLVLRGIFKWTRSDDV